MVELNLPFQRITVRGIIVRRTDGALFGALHRKSGRYAPPGGGLEDGETPPQCLLRELEEENLRLVDADIGWHERLVVDYYHHEHELNLWYVLLVDDVQVGESGELVDARWLDQSQDVWYPGMREKIILGLKEYLPDMLKVHVSVLKSW